MTIETWEDYFTASGPKRPKIQGSDHEMQKKEKKMNFKNVNMDEFGAAHQILSINSGSQTS